MIIQNILGGGGHCQCAALPSLKLTLTFLQRFISRLTKREKMIDLEIDNISSNFSRAIENVVVQVAESWLFRGEPPPAKDRLEYPVPQTDTGRPFFLFGSKLFLCRVWSFYQTWQELIAKTFPDFIPSSLAHWLHELNGKGFRAT